MATVEAVLTKGPEDSANQNAEADQPMTKEAFAHLQAQLAERWQPIDDFDRSPRQILVVPSLSLDQEELRKVQGVHYYEERLLFSLIRLRNPETRLIYVTSQPLHPSIVDYYLELLPGIPSSHARDRLDLFATYDSSLRSLTEKNPGPPPPNPPSEGQN